MSHRDVTRASCFTFIHLDLARCLKETLRGHLVLHFCISHWTRWSRSGEFSNEAGRSSLWSNRSPRRMEHDTIPQQAGSVFGDCVAVVCLVDKVLAGEVFKVDPVGLVVDLQNPRDFFGGSERFTALDKCQNWRECGGDGCLKRIINPNGQFTALTALRMNFLKNQSYFGSIRFMRIVWTFHIIYWQIRYYWYD